MGIHLDPFDPARDFVCGTHFLCAGQPWLRGQLFDKDSVNPRILRQLYDARRIRYATPDELAAGPDAPKVPAVPELSKAERRAAKRAAAEQALKAASPAPAPAGAPDGATESEDERAAKLAKHFSHAALFDKASDLPGVVKEQTKKVIALALIRAGRESA